MSDDNEFFFIKIKHNPPKIVSIGQTIDGMDQIDFSLDENNIDTDKLSKLKEKIGEMNKTSESQPEQEQEPAPAPASESTQETTKEPVSKIMGGGKRRKTKRNRKKRINKKKRLTKRSK